MGSGACRTTIALLLVGTVRIDLCQSPALLGPPALFLGRRVQTHVDCQAALEASCERLLATGYDCDTCVAHQQRKLRECTCVPHLPLYAAAHRDTVNFYILAQAIYFMWVQWLFVRDFCAECGIHGHLFVSVCLQTTRVARRLTTFHSARATLQPQPPVKGSWTLTVLTLLTAATPVHFAPTSSASVDCRSGVTTAS